MDTNNTTAAVETAEEKNVISIPTPISIVRNEVTMQYEKAEMTRGKNSGWVYPKLNVTKENLDSYIAHAGVDNVVKILDQVHKIKSQGWWEDALENSTNEDGTIDTDKAVLLFSKNATDFSARGESIPTLKARREELVALMTKLDTNASDFYMNFRSMSDEIKEINATIASKKRSKDDEDKE